MTFRRVAHWSFCFVVSTVVLGATTAWGETWPSRPIRLVVPFAAGGSTDVLVRLITDRVAPDFPHGFIIDNRGGAAGTIGATMVAKAAPDGYTLLLGSPPDQVTTFYLRKSLPYDPRKDFEPISLLVRGTNVLTVNSSLPVKTVAEFVALAKAKHGSLTFGSAGVGNTSHLSAELFKLEAGVEIRHVPFNGNAQAITSLAGGHIDALFQSPITAAPLVESGKARALAVTSETRVPALRGVPTFGEAGLPGLVVYIFYGILAPANTPKNIVDKLNASFEKALADPKVKAKLAELGFEPAGGPPQNLRSLLERERQRWGKVIQAANIKAE